MGRIETAREEIKAHNYSNIVLNEIVPKIQEVFKDSVGQIVVKSDNYTIYKKYKEELDRIIKEFEDKIRLSFQLDETYKYPKISLYSVGYGISIVFSFAVKDNYRQRHERSITFLSLRDRIVEKIEKFEPFSEINEEEEIERFKKVSKLKEEFEKAKDEINLYSVRTLI